MLHAQMTPDVLDRGSEAQPGASWSDLIAGITGIAVIMPDILMDANLFSKLCVFRARVVSSASLVTSSA